MDLRAACHGAGLVGSVFDDVGAGVGVGFVDAVGSVGVGGGGGDAVSVGCSGGVGDIVVCVGGANVDVLTSVLVYTV